MTVHKYRMSGKSTVRGSATTEIRDEDVALWLSAQERGVEDDFLAMLYLGLCESRSEIDDVEVWDEATETWSQILFTMDGEVARE